MPNSNNQNRNAPYPPRRQAAARPNLVNALAVVIAALILGICIVITGVTVSGSVKKLTAAVQGQNFSSQFSAPSNLTVNSNAPKQYFTETEAAAYLNMTAGEIVEAIDDGDIQDYIRTKSGYTISKATLDAYFEQKAYDTRVQNNS